MELQLDLEDALGIIVYPFASLLALGVMEPNFNLSGVPSFPWVVASGSSWELTFMALVAILSVGYVFFTNWYLGSSRNNQYELYEWAAVLIAVLVIPLYVFVPAVNNFLNGSGWVTLAVVVLQSTGVVLLSYYG